MARQVLYPHIQSGFNVSSPFSVANVQEMAVFVSALNANPGSTQLFTPQAAMAAPGAAPASASFLPIQKIDASGALQLTTAGSFAMALGPHCRGFDQMRFVVSSVAAAQVSVMVIIKA